MDHKQYEEQEQLFQREYVRLVSEGYKFIDEEIDVADEHLHIIHFQKKGETAELFRVVP